MVSGYTVEKYRKKYGIIGKMKWCRIKKYGTIRDLEEARKLFYNLDREASKNKTNEKYRLVRNIEDSGTVHIIAQSK